MYICKQQSDFGILQGFHFHETSHMRSFVKIKPSRKFPNIQYRQLLYSWKFSFMATLQEHSDLGLHCLT